MAQIKVIKTGDRDWFKPGAHLRNPSPKQIEDAKEDAINKGHDTVYVYLVNEENLKDQLANWIDPGVIADALVDEMSEIAEPEEMTFENAKTLYYSFLETELTDALKRSIQRG